MKLTLPVSKKRSAQSAKGSKQTISGQTLAELLAAWTAAVAQPGAAVSDAPEVADLVAALAGLGDTDRQRVMVLLKFVVEFLADRKK
jgi:hypothetical protein